MSDFEKRALELMTRGRKPVVSEAVRAIAEHYPYTLEQVQRAYDGCGCNTRLTTAYLDLAVAINRNDPNEPNWRPELEAPAAPPTTAPAQLGFELELAS